MEEKLKELEYRLATLEQGFITLISCLEFLGGVVEKLEALRLKQN